MVKYYYKLGGGETGLFDVLQRGEAGESMEHLGEIGIVGKATAVGRVDDGHIGVAGQVALRAFYAQIEQIVGGREIGHLRESVPQHPWSDGQFGSDVLDVDISCGHQFLRHPRNLVEK